MDKIKTNCCEVDSVDSIEKQKETNKGRDQWSNNIQFFISITSGSIGLGNVWRFPYLCYVNGGGAFLLPYFICVLLGGIPIFFLEVSLGQFMAAGGLKTWNICPLMQGIGAASAFILFLYNLYYNVIMTWAVYYFFSSFTSVLPWSHCNNDWNTDNCFVFQEGLTANSTNYTSNLNISSESGSFNNSLISMNMSHELFNGSAHVSPVTEFWERKVLKISSGIEEIGIVNWDLALCLLLTWVVMFFCISKGIKSAGKVMYITSTFPFLLLFILLIRGCTLPGAMNGIKFYLLPEFAKLGDLQVWADAGAQVFFSYSLCVGSMAAMGSYNKNNHNCYRDSILFACVNSGTSFFAGFVIFSTLGFMAHQQGSTVADVAESGPGLAFIVYPQAVAEMPLAPLWAILFFSMILLLGTGSQIVGCEGVSTTVFDQFPKLFTTRTRKFIFNGVMCAVSFLVGLLMVTNGGMYVFQLFDFYAGSRMITLIGFLECFTIAYLYGVKRYYKDLVMMLGFTIGPYMKVSWLLLSPVYTMITFVLCIVTYTEIVYNRTYYYPDWSITVGWCVAVIPILLIPLIAGYRIVKSEGATLKERVKTSLEPKLTAPFLDEMPQQCLPVKKENIVKTEQSHEHPLLQKDSVV